MVWLIFAKVRGLALALLAFIGYSFSGHFLMSISTIAPWIERRILAFVNQARRPADLLGPDRLKDAPDDGSSSGYTIGETVAQRLLAYRDQLPRRRYQRLTELDQVPGMGPDKLKDLIYTFGQPADQTFLQDMYDGIIFSNFELKADTIHISDERHFLETVDQPARFIELVGLRVQSLCEARFDQPRACRLALKLLQYAYQERFVSGSIGAYAFALWFFRFDEDNWFSFERVHAACDRYLNRYRYVNDRLELRLFKGFDNAGILAGGITVLDLPVVVNYAEQKITLWSGQLND